MRYWGVGSLRLDIPKFPLMSLPSSSFLHIQLDIEANHRKVSLASTIPSRFSFPVKSPANLTRVDFPNNKSQSTYHMAHQEIFPYHHNDLS